MDNVIPAQIAYAISYVKFSIYIHTYIVISQLPISTIIKYAINSSYTIFNIATSILRKFRCRIIVCISMHHYMKRTTG